MDTAALLPAGQQSEVADFSKGMRRITVWNADGELDAALYLTRSGELPPREWAAEQLVADAPDSLALLAGRPSTPQPDRGPMVCVYHGVGMHEITQAISDGASQASMPTRQ